jgi:archaellum component FlaC
LFKGENQMNEVIDELESLQEEIQNLIDFNESCDGHTDLYQADGLIKERIAKLKGEIK